MSPGQLPRLLTVSVCIVLAGAVSITGCRSPGAVPPTAVPGVRRAAPIPLPRPVRAVWVARFHYRNPDDIRATIKNCAAAGFNTVLWQVRGE